MNKKLTDMETVFKALADSTRLRILGLLMTGEVCVCHIHESLRISQPKASRHLAYLRKARLVETRRDGLWIHYRMAVVADTVLSTVQRTVTHALRHMDVIRQDVERLQKATGCCLPPDDDTRAYTCCGGEHHVETRLSVTR
jgi:ArsR family transcriptional regulator, arsenate/arsenite/antimonite-responsive transcriptional repressor